MKTQDNPTTRSPRLLKRFRIARLEERIAPHRGNGWWKNCDRCTTR